MRKLLLVLLTIFYSFVMYSQTAEDAVKHMNNGRYDIAKIYWEALNDQYNSYGSKISLCNACIELQKKAKSLSDKQDYPKAISVYNLILAKNPADQNAKLQIQICEDNQTNRLRTYSNETYGYSIKLPEYMREGSYNAQEKESYYSSDSKISVVVSTIVDVSNLTDKQILNKVKNKYSGATITYTSSKENWIVLSGYLKNGNTFYDKTIISSRLSQYNETVKILVSAVATNSKEDTRGSDLAKIIHAHLIVNSTGKSVKSPETDNDRWMKARKENTQAAYDSYVKYSPYGSSHITEATARKSILQAIKDYTSGRYLPAKRGFESSEKYLSEYEKTLYMNSYYNSCVAGLCNIEELNTFVRKFPTHPNIKVIKGCYVKLYCNMGLFSAAKNYVKTNYGIWYDENKQYSRKQWIEYIRNNKNLQSKKRFYYDDQFLIGAYMGTGFKDAVIGGYAGGYINKFNVEAHCLYGPMSFAKLYWNPSAANESPIEFTYNPLIAGGRFGYGWVVGNRFRLTPQIGADYIRAIGTSNQGESNYCTSITGCADLKFAIALNHCMEVNLIPQYSYQVYQSSMFKKMSEISPVVNSWANNLSVKLGVGFYF